MIESLMPRSNKRCEMGRSSRAATYRDNMLSSVIINRPWLELLPPVPDPLFALLFIALSKQEYSHRSFYGQNKPCCALFDSCIFR